MARPVKFNFYRVQYDGDFKEHLKGVFEIGLAERTVDIRGQPVRLQEFHTTGGLVCGDFIRIRMQDLPAKASLHRPEVSLLGFDSDEGVGEESAFAYAPDLKVLAFQKGQYTPTIGMFAAYLSRFAGGPAAVDFVNVIQATAHRRLQEMQVVRTFEIDAAGANGSFWEGADRDLRQLGQITARAGAPRISITFKMGHEGGSLNASWVKRAANWFSRREEEGEVTKLRLAGTVGLNDESTLVDLINDRMSDEIDLGRVDVRRLRYIDRSGAARGAMANKRDELEQLHQDDDEG